MEESVKNKMDLLTELYSKRVKWVEKKEILETFLKSQDDINELAKSKSPVNDGFGYRDIELKLGLLPKDIQDVRHDLLSEDYFSEKEILGALSTLIKPKIVELEEAIHYVDQKISEIIS